MKKLGKVESERVFFYLLILISLHFLYQELCDVLKHGEGLIIHIVCQVFFKLNFKKLFLKLQHMLIYDFFPIEK